MDLNISLIFRNESPPRMRAFSTKVQEDTTVASLKETIMKEHGICIEKGIVRIIFGGKQINDDDVLVDLAIGKCTVLHAIVMDTDDNNGANAMQGPNDKQKLLKEAASTDVERMPMKRSSFFVYCKSDSCNKLQRGKLRVRCSGCQSNGIVLDEEPTGWNHVLNNATISVKCLQNNCQDPTAQFYFKCAYCSDTSKDNTDTAVPLPQVHANRLDMFCCTCGDICSPVMDFQCGLQENHVMCIDCFVAYATLCLDDRKFVLIKPYGYTLTCPVSECTGAITEPHHFRLLGKDKYEQYQQLATERCIIEEAVYCPSPNCGAAYFLDDNTDEECVQDATTVFCPACGVCFCRLCKFRCSECICAGGSPNNSTGNQERGAPATVALARQSVSTIEQICKACPKCRSRTERNGGCSHMHCIECGLSWCWVCTKEWTDQCQWDHWFE